MKITEYSQSIFLRMGSCDNCDSQQHEYGDTFVTEHLPCPECVSRAMDKYIADIVKQLSHEDAILLLINLTRMNHVIGTGAYKSKCVACGFINESSYIGSVKGHYAHCAIGQVFKAIGLSVDIYDVLHEESDCDDAPF